MKEKDLSDTMKQLQQNVSKSEQAKEYFKSRNLDPAKIETGYNATTYKDLKHCIVFPLKDHTNNVVGLYGRSIYNNADQKHFYQSNRKGIYPGYPKPETEKLILTEAIIDAASLLQLNSITENYSIISAFGTNGLNEEIKNSIAGLPNLKEIVFAFDNDEAGGTATAKYAEELKQALPTITVSKIVLPCKDVNETLQAHSKEIFSHLLNERAFLFSNEKEKSSTTIPLNKSSKLNTSNSEQVHYNTEELLITLLGGISLQNLDRLRVTIHLRRNPHLSPVYSIRQTIDLYHHDALEKFTRQASERLETGSTVIAETLAALTEELEQYRLNEIEKKKAVTKKKPRKELSAAETKQAISNLEREDLLTWTMDTVIKTGIIGEKENAAILFYGMTSRLLENPVSVITLSSSGTGKSYLMERIAQCFPQDSIIENTHLTDNSLYYFRQDELKHKIMLIEDMDGAANVEYAIRELISKKYITKTAVRKDSKGQLHTEQYRVEGPVAFFGCTTREKLYDDNANRVIPLYLNTGKQQDISVMHYHKQVKAGLVNTYQEEQIREELKNMQLVLKHYQVINPYAPLIDIPSGDFKPRRTLGIVFSFIEAITLYQQYQPSQQQHKEKGCLEVQPEHIEYAFTLLKETLFRKSDELNATIRNFLEALKTLMAKEKKQSFFASDIRKALDVHPRTLRNYLYELNLFSYIKVVGGNKYRKGFEYELTPQAKEENLRTSIDKHIADMMEKIRASHSKRKSEGK